MPTPDVHDGNRAAGEEATRIGSEDDFAAAAEILEQVPRCQLTQLPENVSG